MRRKNRTNGPASPKPPWLRKTIRSDPEQAATDGILAELRLNTVCREAMCPNYSDCFSRKTATFMILGVHCTRNCAFCNVTCGTPSAVDPDEPRRIARAVARLGLRYVVVTSVTRDDLADGGAAHFAAVVRQIREGNPETAVETLIPDFQGQEDALGAVTAAGPAVISHNMETVEGLYPAVRPEADYRRSLDLIRRIRQMNPGIRSKSGFMVGLGETEAQVKTLMEDLRGTGCQLLTIGQYLAPTSAHHPVVEYIHPDLFQRYEQMGYAMGFDHVASAPFVRSSYHAEEGLLAPIEDGPEK